LLLVTAGCAGSNGSGGSQAGSASSSAVANKPASAASGTKDQNACHLLDQNEVSALVEDKIVMRDQTEAGDTWSTCQWENEKGMPLFIMTVYWKGGKQEWDTWRTAQGAGNQILKQTEGVSADQVVKPGVVSGIGDGAYFNGLLPSLVLKGDVLFEMKLFSVPKAGTKFVGLANKLLTKIQ
jgi:hypothetical protein